MAPPININGSNGIFQNTDKATIVPVGTTDQRPLNPDTGTLRLNIDQEGISILEFYDGVNWLNVALALSPFGSGSLPAQIVSGTPNIYAHMTDLSASAGSDFMTINSTSGMNVGDMAFIHQTQSYDPSSNAGNYEIRKITEINENTLVFDSGLENTYASGRFNRTDQTSQVTQVVTSPAYSSVNLNGLVEAKEFDGFNGGIVFLTASESIACNGNYISAWGKGFRGGRGAGGTGSQSSGFAGESIRGHFNNEDNPNDTGGGGGDGDANAGGDSGASGGHATAGGRGEDGSGANPQGGGTIGDSTMAQIFFGGGAGRGGDNDDRTFNTYVNPDTGSEIDGSSNWSGQFGNYTNFQPPWGSNRHSSNPDVSNGGGIVVLAAPSIPNLRATARGIPGVGGSGFGEKSGHGASGSIFVITENSGLSITDVTVASQVQGSIDGDNIGPGGAGRVRLDILGGTTYSGSPTTTGGGTISVNSV